jgi:hypothetical protein
MSILYVGCIKFSTNRFVRNLCPFFIIKRVHVNMTCTKNKKQLLKRLNDIYLQEMIIKLGPKCTKERNEHRL